MLSGQYYLCHNRTMVGSLRVQNIREKRNRRMLCASLSVFARTLAFVCSYVVETLRRLVGRPRLLLAAAYLEFLLKLAYERRIGLVVQVASHHERLSAFLCRLLNDAYRRNAVGFGQREVGANTKSSNSATSSVRASSLPGSAYCLTLIGRSRESMPMPYLPPSKSIAGAYDA